MESTQQLEQQHEKLVQRSELLEAALTASGQDRSDLIDVQKKFAKLLKLTSNHLSQVDHILYPQILQIHNRKLRKNLSRILTRTGHVRTEVRFLMDAWTAKRARKKPSVFMSVAWHFLTILNMRLMGERRIFAILHRCEISLPQSFHGDH